MPIDDIQQFIEKLEKDGQLKRIKTEVDASLEIAEILRRVSYTKGPAVLFENVKDYEMPVLGNAFGSIKRLEIGLETTDFSEIGQRIADMTKMEIPSGIFNKIRKLPELSKMSESFPKLENDLSKEKNNKIETAIVIGGEPATVFSAIAPVPEGLDKYLFAGITRKKGIKTVKCKTVDLEVPANAEIVLEGYVDAADVRDEGPFGDHTGYYTPKEPFPTFTLTGIMQRKKPIYLTTVVGKPILEDAYIGKAIERSFLPLIRMLHPEVTDFSMPPAGWFQGLAIASIKKRYPGQAKKVMMGLWGMGQLALTKIIIIVDHDVNVHDMNEVIWAITTRADAARDTIIIDNTPTDTLDPASSRVNLGSKLGIDATQKTKDEGFEREIQEQVMVDDNTKEKVDSKWSSYGL